MKYLLIGWKIDEETKEIYDMDILETSDTEISITDAHEDTYWAYDVLKVYEEQK